MKKTLPVVLLAILTFLFLGAPKPALAQRGGHGGGGFHGGGSFHGGGGGFHTGGGFGGGGFHGGGAFRGGGASFGGSAFRGGAFHSGFHGAGFNGGWGWRGRGWGWGGWGWGGWGWGWGIGWGWGWPYSYWPGYAYPYYSYYPYGYGPSYPPYDPYYDPSDPPPTRRYRDDPNNNSRPDSNSYPSSVTPDPNDPHRLPAPQSRDSGASTSSPDRPPSANGARVMAAAFRPILSSDVIEATTTNAAQSHLERSSAPRPEVLKAMRALREMPPFAREREIDFGRYSNFSPEERELLRNLDQ